MARADLLIRLVQSSIRGDKAGFRKVVEAIIAEERTKQHKVLAEKLEELLNAAPHAPGSLSYIQVHTL